MKKIERLKSGPMEFDELDFNMGEFDFGETNPKDRSPAKTIRKAIKNTAVSHYSNENTIRRLVNKALPREYGEAFDTYTKGRETVREAVSDFKGTTREPVNEFAKILKNKLPQSLRRTHKLLDYIDDRTSSYKADKFDKNAEEARAIEASLQQLFAAQDDVRQHERDQDEAKANIEKTAELIRFKNHTQILNSIARSTDVLAKNTLGITQAYQKKSLELQYRTVFGIKDTNEQLRLLIAQNRTQLEQIRHNTGLPEAQKLQLNERFTNTIKNKFVDRTLGGLNGGDNVFTAMTDQFAKSLKRIGESVAGALGMTNMALGMDFDTDEDPLEKRRRKITEFATGQVLNVFDNVAGSKAKKAMRGNRKVSRAIRKGASNIKNWMQNGDAMMRDFAFGGDIEEGSVMEILRGLAALATPSRDNDRQISRESGGESLKQPAVLDNAYKRSITEVMPGYLARILQELQITRTGNAKIGLTYFDHDRGSFSSKNDLLKKYEKRLAEGQGAGEPMSALVSAVAKSGGNLNEDAQNRLKKSMLKARMTGSGMTPDALMRESFWKNTGSSQDAKQLAEAFKKFFDSQQTGKFSNTAKSRNRRDLMLDKITEAEAKMRDPRASIQQAYDQGHGDIMEALGFTAEDDKGVSINIDKIIDNALAGSGITKDDIISSKGAPVAGDEVLNNLKRSSKAKSKYKSESSTGYQGNLGALTDVAALSSAALSSIQELQSRFDSQTNDESPQVKYLATLVKVSESSNGILANIAKQLQNGTHCRCAAPTGESFVDSTGNYASDTFTNLSDRASSLASDTKDKVKGFWNSTVGENYDKLKGRLQSGWSRTKKAAGFGFRFGKKTAGMAAEQASKSRLLGARVYQDLKDGIPVIGDLFIGSEKYPRITSAGLQAEIYFDIKGRALTTLMAIADAVDGVFDSENNPIITPAELKKAYVKSNGKIFARVFADRVSRAAKQAGKGISAVLGGVGQTALFAKRRLGFAGNFAKAVLKEALMPPRDVYVLGEDSPRLLAHVMRMGGYLNKIDNSIIDRPTKIKGEVIDLTDKTLITLADISKGLVDEKGQPFKTITQRVAEGMRKRIANTISIAKAGAKMVQGVGKGLRTFVTKGLSGFKDLGGPAGSGSSVQIAEYSHSVLEQIRDILDARLPNNGSGPTITSKTETGENNNGNNAPVMQAPDAGSRVDSSGNVLNGLGSLMGKGIKGVGKLASSLLSKTKLKGLGGLLGGGGASSEEVKDAVKEGQDKTTKEISAMKKENKSLLQRAMIGVRAATGKVKNRYTAAAPAAGGKVKGDTDGDGLRDNSWQDLKNKQRNINEPTKDLSDVAKPEAMNTENTIDVMMGVMKGVLGGVGGMLGNLFGGLGAAGGLLGKAGKFLGKGAGALATGAGWLGKKVLGTAGGALGRAAGGIAGRAGLLGTIGKGALTVGRFALTRALPAAAAGVATVLGSPIVAGALTVGGAVWGLKSLYDLIKGDDDKEVKKYKGTGDLRAFRMAEYGVGMGDTGPTATLMWLENYLYPHVKVDEGKASIDQSKIDAGEIISRFRIDMNNQSQLATFYRWLERRFKPNFLKHAAAAKTAGLKSLSDIDTLKPSNALAFYKAVTQVSEGYNEMANPFGTANDLQVGAEAIASLKQVLSKHLEEKAASSAKDEKTAAETSSSELKRKDFRSMMDTMQVGVDKGLKEGDKALNTYMDHRSNTTVLESYKNDKSKSLSSMMNGGILYSTQNIEALPSQSVTALASIRYRIYGLNEMQASKVASLNGLEAYTQKFIDLSSNGVATFNASPEQILHHVRALFGVAAGDKVGTDKWINWFQNRFLPIFTTYYAQACFHTKAKDLASAAAALRPAESEAVANAMIAAASAAMTVTASPWAGYVLNTSTKTIEGFRETLKDNAAKQLLSEERVKTQPSSSQAPAPTAPAAIPVSYKPELPAQTNTKPAYQANVLPDAESDAKSMGSGATASSDPKPEPTPRAPGVGSLKKAQGNLMSGAGAEAFLRYYKNSTLTGANPEAIKLFRGMVEEYGTITGKKIQLNAGMRTFADQQREYAANPRNAAPPGSSLHEFGLAFDINSADADALEKLGLMRKYGFTRPVGGEPWHIEPAGIQDNVNKYKKDPASAMMAVSASPGRGGGGVGRAKGLYAHGRRNTSHALALFNAGSETVNNDKEGSGSRSAVTPTLTNQGGYAGSAAQIGAEVTGSSADPSNSVAQGLPDYESSPKLKSGSETQARGQAALNNMEGTGGGYSDLKGGSGGSVSDMKKLVSDAAKQVGVDPNLAMTTVAVESSFKAGAAAGTSSAKGLYQFTGGTWAEMIRKHGKSYGIPEGTGPTDARANAIMGALYIKQNLQTAQKSGMPANALSAYLLHFLGPGSGQRFMSLGDNVTPAHAMPKAAAANRSIFFDGGRPRTKQEIMALLQNKLNKAASSFGIGSPMAEDVTQVARADSKAANDAGVAAGTKPSTPAPASSGAPTIQNALYRPDTEPQTKPKPVMVSSNAPSFTPAVIRQAMDRDRADSQVGTMGAADKAMLDGIQNSNKILSAQLTVQQQILEAINSKIESSRATAVESEPAKGALTASTVPSAKPDRSPRKVSEPVIDTRRYA